MPGGWPNAPGTPGCGCATTNGQARSTTSRRSRVSSQKAARRSPGSASSCSRPAAQEGRRGETAPSPRQGRVGSPGPGSRRTLATPAGHAYVAFANFLSPDTLPRTNPLEFSRTTDGGATWSSPVLIDQPSPFAIDFAPKILVLPDGTLLAVFARADFAAGLAQLYAVRSPIRGAPACAAARAAWLQAVPPTPSMTRAPPCRSRDSPAQRSPPTAASTSPSRTTSPRAQERSAWPRRGTAAAPGAAPRCRG